MAFARISYPTEKKPSPENPKLDYPKKPIFWDNPKKFRGENRKNNLGAKNFGSFQNFQCPGMSNQKFLEELVEQNLDDENLIIFTYNMNSWWKQVLPYRC